MAANRGNSKVSPGPQTERGKANSCRNAVQHGILAKRVALATDEERAEFQALLQACNAEFGPEGLIERFLVEEIATLFWKVQIAVGLETKELSSRQGLRDRLTDVFHGEIELPINAEDLPLDRGWDCERLTVRAIAGRDVGHSGASHGPAVLEGQTVGGYQSSRSQSSQNVAHVELEAVLGNSLANVTRYQSLLKRDLYKAMDKMRDLRAEKREREEAKK